MCPYPMMHMNWKYIRDCQRGRDWKRFDKLEVYAYKRWTNTKDLAVARRWLCILDDIKARRQP